MGSRRPLPPSFPLFGRQQGTVSPDITDEPGFDDSPLGQSSMTPAQQFTLFPPLPNTGDIERRNDNDDFEPLDSGSAFTTPVGGQLTSQQQYYAEMRMMLSTTEAEYPALDSGSSVGHQRSAVNVDTPLQLGQSKSSLELDYEPLEYMDSTPSPPRGPQASGDGLYASGYSTPIPGATRGSPAAETDMEEVDEDFVLNVIQEGELERLTRMAVEETKIAWKHEIMGELRKQTNSLADDDWIYA